MDMEHSQYIKLQAQLQDHFDGRYQKLGECMRIVESERADISELKINFAKLNTKLTILIGILGTIAVPVIALCIKLLFGG